MLGWDWYGFNKMRARTSYAELVFLHPVGSVGHVVQSGASAARDINTPFVILWCNWYGFHNKRIGHVTPNLCFCIWWDLWLM
jgi:hypothetical protein